MRASPFLCQHGLAYEVKAGIGVTAGKTVRSMHNNNNNINNNNNNNFIGSVIKRFCQYHVMSALRVLQKER